MNERELGVTISSNLKPSLHSNSFQYFRHAQKILPFKKIESTYHTKIDARHSTS